jgi:hypothetical protein
VLEACAQDAGQRDLPLHFRVLGHVDKPMPLWPNAPLSITGSYAEDSLAELIALERPTRSSSFRWSGNLLVHVERRDADGMPIIAPRLGAFPSGLRGYDRHHPPAARRSRFIHQRHAPRRACAPAIREAAALGDMTMAPEEYRRKLVAAMAPASPGEIPPLPPGVWFPPVKAPIPVSLKDLYQTGIECGHGETRAYLQARVSRYDYELDLANVQVRNATAEIAPLRRRERPAAARARGPRAAATSSTRATWKRRSRRRARGYATSRKALSGR